MTELRQTAFRLTEADLAIIDSIKRELRLDTRAQALRYILRHWEPKKKGRRK